MTTPTLTDLLGDPATWQLQPWVHFFDGNQVALPMCPVCGVACRDVVQHYNWHMALGK